MPVVVKLRALLVASLVGGSLVGGFGGDSYGAASIGQGTTQLVSISTDGTQGNDYSGVRNQALSADGKACRLQL